MQNSFLSKLVLRTPMELLKKLVDFNQARLNEDNLIEMLATSISLRSGQLFEGVPCKIDEKSILFLNEEQVSLFQLNDVVAVHLGLNSASKSILSAGKYFELGSGAQVSVLNLRRGIDRVSEKIKTAYGIDLVSPLFQSLNNLGEIERFQLQRFLTGFSDVLAQIAADELGNQALKQLDSLEIVTGSSFSLQTNEKQFTIAIDLSSALPEHIYNDLQVALEQNL